MPGGFAPRVARIAARADVRAGLSSMLAGAGARAEGLDKGTPHFVSAEQFDGTNDL